MGYHRAGFEVVGVDIKPQPNYPFEFHQADAMAMRQDVLRGCWHEGVGSVLPGRLAACLGHFDAIHASPPCQAYSTLAVMNNAHRDEYPDLYEPVRAMLQAQSLPYVIENVIGAPYRSGFVLCGSMFGMKVRRHRNFETSFAVLMDRHCDHASQGRVYGVYGHGGGGQQTRGYKGKPSEYQWLMDMPWAKPREITQAVPPAYTEWIGAQLLACVEFPEKETP